MQFVNVSIVIIHFSSTNIFLNHNFSFVFRWLAVRLEFIGNFILFFAAFFGVIARGDIESGLVGLSITVALEVSDN